MNYQTCTSAIVGASLGTNEVRVDVRWGFGSATFYMIPGDALEMARQLYAVARAIDDRVKPPKPRVRLSRKKRLGGRRHDR